MEGFSQNNPLGLSRDDQGQVHQLQLYARNREGRDKRLTACAALCSLLNGQEKYTTVFNSLTYPQQVIVTQIREDAREQNPHRVLDHYLRTTPELCALAIISSAHSAANTVIVTKKMTLGYMADYLRMRSGLGHAERLGRFPAGTGGGQ